MVVSGDKLQELNKVMATYNPDMQAYLCRDYKKWCYFGNAPTLATLRQYDDTADRQWLSPQLWNLSEYSGTSGKMSKQQIRELASVIATEYPYLKITELMVFFFQFKAGKYGKFYGNVDPMVITTALREFIEDRNAIYLAEEQEQNRKRELLEREQHRRNAITWEEWQKRKNQAK